MFIQGSVSINAGTTNSNIIAGSQFEYLPRNARVDIGLVGSATGLVADVTIGQDLIAQSMALSLQNRMPIVPDDYSLSEVGIGGERIVIKVTNPTGGALTCFYGIRITPV